MQKCTYVYEHYFFDAVDVVKENHYYLYLITLRIKKIIFVDAHNQHACFHFRLNVKRSLEEFSLYNYRFSIISYDMDGTIKTLLAVA